MDEKNINISKSEEELLEIMENRSHITADQLHNLKEDEECLQACSDLAEIVIEMQKKQNMLAIDVRNELADFHNKHSKNVSVSAILYCCPFLALISLRGIKMKHYGFRK